MMVAKLKQLVQYSLRSITLSNPYSCSICKALVASIDQEGHRQWHANNKETTN